MASTQANSSQKSTDKTNTHTDKYIGTIRAMEGKENYYRVVGKAGSKYRIRFLDDGSSIRLLKSQVKAHPVVEGIAVLMFNKKLTQFGLEKKIKKKRFRAYDQVNRYSIRFLYRHKNKRCVFKSITSNVRGLKWSKGDVV